jgi:hypothetical protein
VPRGKNRSRLTEHVAIPLQIVHLYVCTALHCTLPCLALLFPSSSSSSSVLGDGQCAPLWSSSQFQDQARRVQQGRVQRHGRRHGKDTYSRTTFTDTSIHALPVPVAPPCRLAVRRVSGPRTPNRVVEPTDNPPASMGPVAASPRWRRVTLLQNGG